MEQDLEIIKNGEYKNINLKTRVDKSTGQVQQGLTKDNYIIVEKVDFDKSLKVDKGSYNLYRCTALYKDEVVSFFLNRDDEGEAWDETGGLNEKVKITATSIPYKYKGEEKTRLGLVFELVA